jgi:hypothetical protein
MKEKGKEGERKKKNTFLGYIISPFGFALPSSSNLGFINW